MLPPEHQDRPANRPWAELPEFYKMSNRRACDHLPIKLAQAGLHMEHESVLEKLRLEKIEGQEPIVTELTDEEVELLARLEHRRWLIERRLLGWKHGAKRNEAKRINPLLVEWDKLPEQERDESRRKAADLPKTLAGASRVLRRVHLVRAFGDWLTTAGPLIEQAEKHKEQKHNVVIAEID